MAELDNTGGSLRQITLPYPEFRLGEIIDPYEHNANNSETINKINQMITVLNSFINGEANTSLSAMAVAMPGVDPIEASDLETFLRTLIGSLRSKTTTQSGAHFIGSETIPGVPGENIWQQLASLSMIITGIDPDTGEVVGDDDSVNGQVAKILRDFTKHISSADHDTRYHTKEYVDGEFKKIPDAYVKKDGDFQGTWKSRTLEQVTSASGTGFGLIETVSTDPVNPKVGQVWILV